ncbi:MAG: rhamnulokinase [Promicromonosporaceae bacterium]|nr:rhamnulokinase [Promicromonosporaceae bacterium]
MTQLKRYVALDLGAESGRAIAASFDGKVMELEVLHRFATHSTAMLGTLYWDFPSFMREIKFGLSAYTAKYGAKLSGIACDAWGVDFGLLDKTGHLLSNPVHYRDARTKGMAEKLHAIIPSRTLYQRTGIQIMEINTIYQLYSMVRANSPLLDKAVSMLLIADLISYFLSGTPAQEYTLATTSEMYDAEKRDWSRDTLLSAKIPPVMMPEIVAPGTVVGPLLDAVAAECGLSPTPVIAPGSHDTASAVVGAPLRAGSAYISSGTWSLVGVELDAPILSAAAREAGFTNELGADGTVRFLKNVAGLWVFDECRRQWEREGTPQPLAELLAQTAAQPPSARVIDLNGPQFLPPGDMPARVREAARAEGLAADHPAQAARLVLDSLAHAYAAAIRQAGALTGSPIREVVVVGGGSQNRLLNHLTAAATGLPVVAGPVEAAALGNVLIQARAVGGGGQTLTELRSLTTPNPSQR